MSIEITYEPISEFTFIDEITVLILTYNEAPNIGRALEKLSWARRIVIVDSFSTDETLAISKRFPNVEVLQRRFDTFARQCNFGLQHISSRWVLSLDADYILSDALVAEIKNLAATDVLRGYTVQFRYCIDGKPLRNSLYPPRTVLFRTDGARYEDDGHGHRVIVPGETKMLRGSIDHDDRKSLDRWLNEQLRYSSAEAWKLTTADPNTLGWPDRARRWIVPAPFMVFIYTLLIQGMILDGWQGWYYVLQRTLAEILLSLRLIEQRLID